MQDTSFTLSTTYKPNNTFAHNYPKTKNYLNRKSKQIKNKISVKDIKGAYAQTTLQKRENRIFCEKSKNKKKRIFEKYRPSFPKKEVFAHKGENRFFYRERRRVKSFCQIGKKNGKDFKNGKKGIFYGKNGEKRFKSKKKDFFYGKNRKDFENEEKNRRNSGFGNLKKNRDYSVGKNKAVIKNLDNSKKEKNSKSLKKTNYKKSKKNSEKKNNEKISFQNKDKKKGYNRRFSKINFLKKAILRENPQLRVRANSHRIVRHRDVKSYNQEFNQISNVKKRVLF